MTDDRKGAMEAFEAFWYGAGDYDISHNEVHPRHRDLARNAWFIAWDAAWRTAIAHERAECAKVCEARYMGDNNREDAEAKRCAAAIRARAKENRE